MSTMAMKRSCARSSMISGVMMAGESFVVW